MANRHSVSAADQFDNTQATQARSDAHRWHAGSEESRSRIRKPRRGVLLLVCLVLLVMFLMLGVTFVLTAGNFRRSSEAYQRMLERPSTDLPERSGDLLDSVARDLVRGTNNLNSPFSDENLLEDLYGQPLLRGTIRNNPSHTPGTGSPGQHSYYCPLDRNGEPVRAFLELAITPDADYAGLNSIGVNDYAGLNSIGVNDYAGLVLTFLSGDLKGQSVRVVASINTDSGTVPVLTVLAPAGSVPQGPSATEAPSKLPVQGDVVLVNGRPFSGDGTGSRFHAAGAPRQLNESYDAVDINNPWLAYVGDNGSGASVAKPSWGDASYDWVPGGSGLSRPFGSTPSVDCDNDGAADAIWIDAGLPLQMLPDGSYVKPLVAMLVRDLDGRVNLNAHGSQNQTKMITSTTQALGQGYGPAEIDPGYALIHALDAGETVLLNTPRNENGVATVVDEDENFKYGLYDKRAQEGNVEMPADGTADPDSTDAEETYQNFYDFGDLEGIATPLDAEGKGLHAINPDTGGIYFQPTGNSNFSFSHAETNYGLHVDTVGGGTATTPYGPQDLEAVLRFPDADSDSLESKLLSDLHDIVVTVDDSNGNIDGTHQADFDHQQMQHLRQLLTTDSWDLPTPSLNWPEELVPGPTSSFKRPRQITDLFARKFQQENSGMTDAEARTLAESLVVKLDLSNLSNAQPLDATGATFTVATVAGSTPDQLKKDLKKARNKLVARQLIAPGLLRGTRMNVNRLFGNGEDDPDASGSGNGVVDEPGEVLLSEATWAGAAFDHNGDGFTLPWDTELYDATDQEKEGETQGDGQGYSSSPSAIDPDMDGDDSDYLSGGSVTDPDDRVFMHGDTNVRQQYAQQLYLLLMLLADGLDSQAPAYSGSTPGVTGKEVLARRLAQYAVNAADYRDADSIMTPFEYDPTPFDSTGWTEEADGNLRTRPSPLTVNNYGVVWGTEAPALVMTETLALHDRRTRDEAKDASYISGPSAQNNDTTTPVTPAATTPAGSPKMEDDNYDQYALPQGSLFIELQRIAHHGYKPKTDPTTGQIERDQDNEIVYTFEGPQDLYDAGGFLNLSKTVTRNSSLFPGLTVRSGQQDPVWRIAISYPHQGSGGNIAIPPGQDANYKSPDRWPLHQSSGSNNPSWDPNRTMQPYPFTMDPFATSPSVDDVQCERFVWFHRPTGTSSPPSDVYFNQFNTELKLEPGEYALIGPREVTPLGRGDLTQSPIVASDQEIRLGGAAGGVSATDTDGITKKWRYGEDLLRTTKFMICGADRPNSWTPYSPGTTKSRKYVPLSVSEPLRSAYYDENVIDADPSIWPANVDPTDYDQYWPQGTTDTAGNPLRSYPDIPFDRDTIKNYPISKLSILEGMVNKYRTAFLQRLANPLLPYNPDPNAVPSGATYDPNLEINPYIAVDAMPIDLTVFNGDATDETLNVNEPSLAPTLSPELLARSRERGGVQEITGTGQNNQSVTYSVKKPLFPAAFMLNKDSRRPTAAEKADGVDPDAFNEIRDFKNTDAVAGSTLAFPYELDETLGARNSIFYASEFDELGGSIDPALVVTQNAFWREGPLVSGYELMMVPASAPGTLTGELGSFESGTKLTDGFPHLLNFQAEASSKPRLSRIFEYVHVPSHYADTHVVLPHTDVYATHSSYPYGSVKDFPQFAPPFNSVSTYREPGRVNINTVSEEAVWQSVMNGMPGQGSTHPGPDFNQIVSDRQGSTGESKAPFRSPGVTHQVPKKAPDGTDTNTEINGNPLLAPMQFQGQNNSDLPTSDLTNPSDPNGNNLDNTYYDNNDFLRYQPVNRMGNLLTTRSNVYGVWMTLGFFATDADGNIDSTSSANDQEAGRSSGMHQRHRAFYLIDRSIPVAYEQGHDHNTEEVFRLKRFIE